MIRSIWVTLSFAATLAGCGAADSSATASEPRSLQAIKESGELVVVTRNAPTTWYIGPRGEARGPEYEKAKEFFRKGLDLAEDPIQRVSFYEGLLKADEGQRGEDQLSETGKEALLKIAEININQGSSSEAKKRLQRLSELDPKYRQDRVEELLNQLNTSGN